MVTPTDPAALVQLLRERAYTGDAEDEKLILAAADAIERLTRERDEALKERTVAQFQRNALVELSGQKGNAAFGTLFVRMADALVEKQEAEAESGRLAQENERLRAALKSISRRDHEGWASNFARAALGAGAGQEEKR